MLKVCTRGLLYIDQFDRGIGKQILGPSQDHGIAWMPKRVNPVRAIQIKDQTWLEEKFSFKWLDASLKHFWVRCAFQFSTGFSDNVDMFNIRESHPRGEMIRERDGIGRHRFTECATDVAINGSRRRHPKRWLDAMHKVWAAEGGGNSLRHNFEDLHCAHPFLSLTRRRFPPWPDRR